MRILGIDYGDVRVGLAVSDPSEFLASGIGNIKISGMNNAVTQISEIIKQKDIAEIVLGLPLNMDGSEGESGKKIRVFGAKLSEAFPDMPIHYLDERRTTILAAGYMNETGTFGKKRKDSVDTLSAQIILQTYLDRKKNISPEE